MVFKGKISPEIRALAVCLREKHGESYPEIAKRCKISVSSAERICKTSLSLYSNSKTVKRHSGKKMGRPRKVSDRCKRLLHRNLVNLRAYNPNVTVKKLLQYSGLSLQTASRRTYARCLNELGFGFRQARKKGLLRELDRKLRIQFAKEVNQSENSCTGLWMHDVAFYLDGVSFIFKSNPLSGAMAPKARVWRKKGEGLIITAKGSKDLAGGKRLHVMVAIAYNKGVILCEPYDKMNGKFFASFIRQHFNLCFGKAGPKRDGKRLFVMDNDPSQISKMAENALTDIECELLRIPPRSPDINPIENVFHLVKNLLESEAIQENITCETFEQFKTRVLRTIKNVDPTIIDKTIESMPQRIRLIIKGKGYRTKY